jgi:hypothetical protein
LQNSAALRTKVFGGMFGGATQKQNNNSTIISFAYSCNMMETPAAAWHQLFTPVHLTPDSS